ncbi:MAG TPA: HNH endonuclease signature motif containing protein [Pseudomonas sp.]|uniref:HNH endonuclease signature motif containing protein n=1 Tax=Pseudomonas sp. TaxID=306 RepID=UPI002C10BAC9|nr:HNH endonuclease signature motif containing protein [Pseudomonas sp.]HWH86195.1 HNH endonuclease signature motif containing protein [Pseudomonas sp.]
MNPIAERALARAREIFSPGASAKKAPTRKFWTTSDEHRLAELYGDTPMAELIATFGRPDYAIYGKAASLGLKRSAAYLASEHACRLRRESKAGEAFRFKKGQRPWNKGISFDCGGRSVETRFAPGTMPHNNVPVGTERVTDDGIRQRKVRDDGPAHRRWKSVHSLIWEEAYGEIPPGHIVVFRNRNTQDITLENLELLSRAENMRRNTFHRYPPELKDTIRQLNKLRRAINEASHEK